MIATVVCRGRQVQGPARRRPRHAARLADERPQIAVDRKRYVYYPGTQRSRSNAAPQHPQPPAQHHRGGRDPAGRRRGRAASRRVAWTADTRFYVKDRKLHYVHNYVGQGDSRSSDPRTACPQGATSCGSSSSRRASPISAHGKGRPAGPSSTSTRSWWARSRWRSRRPCHTGSGGGLSVGADVGSPVTSDYRAPFPFTGKIYKVTVDVSGELIQDDELAMRKIMARQ